MQLDLFNETELMSSEEIKKHKAKIYTAKSIYQSSGQRKSIKQALVLNDVKQAFKEFDKAFRTYGFSHKPYSFLGVSGKG